MVLSELKRQVDILCEIGYGEKSVLVTLSDKSIGARAAAGITNINVGFDWEQGQIRISTDKKIISYDKDRDLPMSATKWDCDNGNGKIRHLLICPKCDNRLKKDDRYCSNCGQRLIGE